jgi:hypothetical protein
MNDLIKLDLSSITVKEDVTLLDRGLPKWPQMRVEGVPVTLEQAKEIIRRTDTFFTPPLTMHGDF